LQPENREEGSGAFERKDAAFRKRSGGGGGEKEREPVGG
jgi:hypothetical protein